MITISTFLKSILFSYFLSVYLLFDCVELCLFFSRSGFLPLLLIGNFGYRSSFSTFDLSRSNSRFALCILLHPHSVCMRCVSVYFLGSNSRIARCILLHPHSVCMRCVSVYFLALGKFYFRLRVINFLRFSLAVIHLWSIIVFS